MGHSWCCLLLLWLVLSPSTDATPVHSAVPQQPYSSQYSGVEAAIVNRKEGPISGAHARQEGHPRYHPSEIQTASGRQENVSGFDGKEGSHVSEQEATPGFDNKQGGYHHNQASKINISSNAQKDVSGGHDKRGSGTTHNPYSVESKTNITSKQSDAVSGYHNEQGGFHTGGLTHKPQLSDVDDISKQKVLPGYNIGTGDDTGSIHSANQTDKDVVGMLLGGSIDAPSLTPNGVRPQCKPGFKVVHGICREVIE